MRDIRKGHEPATMAETRTAVTTDLSTTERARAAFNQIDKGAARAALIREQGALCAFCMLRIGAPDADKNKFIDTRGEPTMKIAHRVPIQVDPSKALTWRNLLGSCDGGQRSIGLKKTCDWAQGSAPLTIDPTEPNGCSRLRYERRGDREGLFITSDDPALRDDVEKTLALNAGDLPDLRQKTWEAFCMLQRGRAPRRYGKDARRDYYREWIERGPKLPEMAGVVEAMLR